METPKSFVVTHGFFKGYEIQIEPPPTPPAWVDELALELARTIECRIHTGKFADCRRIAKIQCKLIEIIQEERTTNIGEMVYPDLNTPPAPKSPT